MENLINQLDNFYNGFMGTKIVPEIYNKYTDKYIMSKEDSERLLKFKIKPEIEIAKENIKRIDDKLKELEERARPISSITTPLSDPDCLQKWDELYKEQEIYNKERRVWSEIFDRLKLHRTLVFCGDYKRRYTENQKILCRLIENSKIAKESVAEFINYIKGLDNFESFKNEYEKLENKKDLIKLSSQMILKYAKSEFEINAVSNIQNKRTIMKSISILIKSIIKGDEELIDIANGIEEFEKSFLSGGYYFEDSINMAKFISEKIKKIMEILNNKLFSEETKKEVDSLRTELEKINISALLSDLEYEIGYDFGDSAKMYEEDRKKSKKFLIEVGIREGNFVNKSIMLNNLIFEKFPKDKDDLDFIRESIIILYFYIRTYSLESFSPLVLYTI